MPDSTAPHLLLVNLGTADAPTPEAVRVFLTEFLSDPAVVDLPRWFWRPVLEGMVLRSRPHRVAHQYASIWTDEGSPLRVATDRMVAAVRAHAGDRLTVSAAYRYGEPSLDAEMRRLANEHNGRVFVVPLFAQRTDATTGTAFRRAREAAVRAGIAHRVEEVLVAPSDNGYIAALVARWNEAIDAAEPPEHLVISFHGIPTRYNRREGRQYTRDCEDTAAAFLSAIAWPTERATLAYQSKFGPEPWLKPATADVIEQLGRRGVRRIAVVMPGFITDGLETIEEIGIRGTNTFRAAGGEQLIRIRAVEDHASIIHSLVRLVGI